MPTWSAKLAFCVAAFLLLAPAVAVCGALAANLDCCASGSTDPGLHERSADAASHCGSAGSREGWRAGRTHSADMCCELNRSRTAERSRQVRALVLPTEFVAPAAPTADWASLQSAPLAPTSVPEPVSRDLYARLSSYLL